MFIHSYFRARFQRQRRHWRQILELFIFDVDSEGRNLRASLWSCTHLLSTRSHGQALLRVSQAAAVAVGGGGDTTLSNRI